MIESGFKYLCFEIYTMNTTIFKVPGLDCPAEEALIRNKLKNINEIKDLQFNFINQELKITHNLSTVKTIQTAIAEIGMQANLKDTATSAKPLNASKKANFKKWLLIIVSGILALAAEITAYIQGSEKSALVFVLSLLAIALTGGPTFKKGFIALRTVTLNINFLMMVAICGAVLIGEWPEAAMVTVLFTLAEVIERYSLDKSRMAIEKLMELAPETALVKSLDSWETKPIKLIQLDDTVKVKPGDKIPLDGIITNGQSMINEAPITGESMPVSKNIGDIVYAGTINENGSFEFKVTAEAANTLLAKIVLSVEEAQADRAPTQRFVDQFSKIYTPIMVVLAILIALIPPLVFSAPFYPWIAKALILLVIACPCALVISTPVTVVSGLAAAAKLGLLIKGGTYLENGHKLQAIALDKTGTLTQGKPAVTDIVAFNNITNEQLLTIAASLDTHSEHPVAYAIVNHWESKNIKDSLLEVDQFLAIPGRGVTGYIENKQYYVGNHKLAEENGICNAEVESVLEKIEQEGKTTVVISTSRQVLGIIAVSDSLRPSSKEAISRLRKIGVKTIMLTGDNKIMAQTIGKQVGIDEVNANMLPEDKLAIIDRLINK
ncbi:MAG: heavy metal translocating P-type ATPase, partial [Burkholderiales bacterium]|nr:heavy metal translocating P-type ATPase [Burkholderiales bacterium]